MLRSCASLREQQVLAEDDICVAVHVELHERRLLVTATEQQLRHRGAARLAQQAVRLPHGGRVPRRRGTTARNQELRRQLSAQKCDSKFPRQVSVVAVALVDAEQQRVMYKRVRSASICIRIRIRRHSIGEAHQRIRIQIRSFSFSVFTAARNIKAHPEYPSRSFFKFDPACQCLKLFRLRILNRMFSRAACRHDLFLHFGNVWLGQFAKSGQPLLAFRMCSTKSSTSVKKGGRQELRARSRFSATQFKYPFAGIRYQMTTATFKMA